MSLKVFSKAFFQFFCFPFQVCTKNYWLRKFSKDQQSDQLRSAVKEINTLKAELREIKQLVKGLVK